MSPNRFGYFVGEVGNDWPGDQTRKIRLTRSIRYMDHGREWFAGEGAFVDGAVGFYRRATVFHDVYCEKARMSSAEVHLMFWRAMRCDILNMARWRWKVWGRTIVAPDWLWSFVCWQRACQAWVMWLMVRTFGPRF